MVARAPGTATTGGSDQSARLITSPLLRYAGARSASTQAAYGAGPVSASPTSVARAAVTTAPTSARRCATASQMSTGTSCGFGAVARISPSGMPVATRSGVQAIAATAASTITVTL